jgi:hypothetical protein
VGAGAADMSCGDHGDVSGGRGRQGGLEGGVGGGDGAAKKRGREVEEEKEGNGEMEGGEGGEGRGGGSLRPARQHEECRQGKCVFE